MKKLFNDLKFYAQMGPVMLATMPQKEKEKTVKMASRIYKVMLAMCLLAVVPTMVYAAPDTGKILKQVVNIISWVFTIIGAFIIVPAIPQLVMAFKEENGQEMTKQVRNIAVGVALVIMSQAIPNMGLLNDIGEPTLD